MIAQLLEIISWSFYYAFCWVITPHTAIYSDSGPKLPGENTTQFALVNIGKFTHLYIFWLELTYTHNQKRTCVRTRRTPDAEG